MDGRTDGQFIEWMDGWMDGWIERGHTILRHNTMGCLHFMFSKAPLLCPELMRYSAETGRCFEQLRSCLVYLTRKLGTLKPMTRDPKTAKQLTATPMDVQSGLTWTHPGRSGESVSGGRKRAIFIFGEFTLESDRRFVYPRHRYVSTK